MTDTVDLLQIKIEKAKRELPLETVNAIDAVDWKTSILGLRAKKGYTFEQLGDLELETELLLCGLVSPEGYPKELEKRMGISKAAADELVNEMNNLIFKKIREELIKNTERKKIFQKNSPLREHPLGGSGQIFPPRSNLGLSISQEGNNDAKVLNSTGIEIVPEKLEITNGWKPAESMEDILQKIEKPEEVKKITNYELRIDNEKTHPILTQKLSSSTQTPVVKTDHSLNNLTGNRTSSSTPKVDPYREIPE